MVRSHSLKKDGTGRNRRTRSHSEGREDGFRRPCSQRQTTISGGPGSFRAFSRKGTTFPSSLDVEKPRKVQNVRQAFSGKRREYDIKINI